MPTDLKECEALLSLSGEPLRCAIERQFFHCMITEVNRLLIIACIEGGLVKKLIEQPEILDRLAICIIDTSQCECYDPRVAASHILQLLLTECLAAGVDLASNESLIQHAIRWMHRDIVSVLVGAGAKISANLPAKLDLDFYTQCLIRLDNQQWLTAFLNDVQARGAEIDLCKALYIASACAGAEVVEVLIAFGADAKSIYIRQYTGERETPLCAAVRHENISAVKALLQHGADANLSYAVQSPGRYHPVESTVLHHAVILKNEQLIRLLCQAGANIHGLDEKGYTPLHLAAKQGDVALARVLIAAGETFTWSPQANKETPLALAVYYDQIPMVQFLLKLGHPTEDILAKLASPAWRGVVYPCCVETTTRIIETHEQCNQAAATRLPLLKLSMMRKAQAVLQPVPAAEEKASHLAASTKSMG